MDFLNSRDHEFIGSDADGSAAWALFLLTISYVLCGNWIASIGLAILMHLTWGLLKMRFLAYTRLPRKYIKETALQAVEFVTLRKHRGPAG